MSAARPEPPVLPPTYLIVPTPVAYAPVPDAVLVTMVRILGLCWRHDYRRTPPLTLDRLSHLLGRPNTTLRRHLAILEDELGWLRRERQGRRFTLILLPPARGGEGAGGGEGTRGEGDPPISPRRQGDSLPPARGGAGGGEGNLPSPSGRGAGGEGLAPRPELERALAEAGIENPFRRQLAADPHLRPEWVTAWQLWTRHPDRAGLTNPTGYIVRRLQHHDPPPEPYLHLARLTPGQWSLLERAYWLTDDQLDPDIRRARPLYDEIFEHERRG